MNDPVINALRAEQQKLAMDFFRRPPKYQDLGFEYGLAFGTYQGIELAIQRILKLYRDEKEDAFD